MNHNKWKLKHEVDEDRVIMSDGMLSIHKAVFEVALRKLGLDKQTIKEELEYPVTEREAIIREYEELINKGE